MKFKIMLEAQEVRKIIEYLESFPLKEVRGLLETIGDQADSQLHMATQFREDIEKFKEEWEYKPDENYFDPSPSIMEMIKKYAESQKEEPPKRKYVRKSKTPAKRGRPSKLSQMKGKK